MRGLLLLALAAGCGEPVAYEWNLPADWEPPPVPVENPMTAAKVELGRQLFYSKLLSANRTQSCASCHEQSRGFAEARATSIGSTGDELPRNAPGLANVGYLSSLTWVNPLLTTLERQIPVPMLSEDPVELGMTGAEKEILARLTGEFSPGLRQAFGADEFEMRHVVWSLSAFLRTMVSADSTYDRHLRGEVQLSDLALRGLGLFEERCAECHEGPQFTSGRFVKTDVGAPLGLFEFTGDEDDRSKIRVAPLRNVAETAPYMHDGSLADLEGVLRVHAGSASDNDAVALEAFLRTLSDETFLSATELGTPD